MKPKAPINPAFVYGFGMQTQYVALWLTKTGELQLGSRYDNPYTARNATRDGCQRLATLRITTQAEVI